MDDNSQLRIVVVVPIIAAVIFVSVMLGTSASNPSLQEGSNNKNRVVDLERWPIAEYEATLPGDPAQRAKRQAKNKKYDKSDWPIVSDDVSDSTVRLHQVDPNLPAFPTERSTVVLIGRIVSGGAHLSNDKTGVYSEFSVIVEEALKNSLPERIVPGSPIDVIREGGRIRFPSGRVHWYGIAKQNMPRLSGRYVLFLTGETEQALTILTGYELVGDKVNPLDEVENSKKYLAADETTFMSDLKASIANR